MNEAPTIVARISKLERDTALIMGQLGLVSDDDARSMVENCLAQFAAWDSGNYADDRDA